MFRSISCIMFVSSFLFSLFVQIEIAVVTSCELVAEKSGSVIF